ncbi:MAG: hypothetical protein JNM74_13735 [Myxococcales bacterium]|nr:hypothetical protein [Myxococcales bacterium]
MGALSTDRPEAHSLEARLAFAGKALAARVVSESPHTFLERFVREPSPHAVRFVSDFGRAYGFGPPRDLVGFSSLAALRPVVGDFELSRSNVAPGEDSFVSIVREGGASALLGLLIGALPIARTDTGDTYYVTLYEGLDEPRPTTPRRVSRDAVFAYSWVKRALVGPLTRDLSSFAFAAALADARKTGELDDTRFLASAELVRPHVARRSPFLDIEKVTRKGLSPYVPPRASAHQWFSRALWIFGLFADDGTFDLDDVRRAFTPRLNPPLTKAVWERYLRAMPTCVPTALYVLFRTYLLDDEARLSEAIALAKSSPARIVVDAASFFDDASRGKRDSLGIGRSVVRAKADVAALGLSAPPSSRLGRSRVQPPASDREVPSSSPSSLRSTYKLRTLEDLEALAWEKLDDTATHDAIRSTLSERPEVECALRIVEYVDTDGHMHDNLVLQNEKDEALLALRQHGHPILVPLLVGRALREDLRAIEMLGALGSTRATRHLVGLLDRPPQRYRHLETSVVGALRALGAREVAPRLVELLAANPLRDWKEGLERGPLVRELVQTLGALEAPCAGPALHELVSSRSLEVRPLVPACAEALGRLEYAPAAERLRELTRLSATLRDGVPTELVWALGQLGFRSAEERRASLDLCGGIELVDRAAEVVRLAARRKLGDDIEGFEDALERALWEPGFKRDETSRRRTWAFRSFAEVGGVEFDRDAVRYFTTLDDHAVREAATSAFRAQGHRVPRVRAYYRFVLPDIERRGLDALHQALHDPKGVFRYNVALRLSAIGHPSSVEPLVRSLRRIFDEPLSSTFEYDDAPHNLVWTCKALKRMQSARGNLALIEGLRSTDPHVRAVIADDPPEDARVVPELVRLLSDPRSFVRTRAERALRAYRDHPELGRLVPAPSALAHD